MSIIRLIGRKFRLFGRVEPPGNRSLGAAHAKTARRLLRPPAVAPVAHRPVRAGGGGADGQLAAEEGPAAHRRALSGCTVRYGGPVGGVAHHGDTPAARLARDRPGAAPAGRSRERDGQHRAHDDRAVDRHGDRRCAGLRERALFPPPGIAQPPDQGICAGREDRHLLRGGDPDDRGADRAIAAAAAIGPRRDGSGVDAGVQGHDPEPGGERPVEQQRHAAGRRLDRNARHERGWRTAFATGAG